MFWQGRRAATGAAVALCAALAGCGGGDSGGVAPSAAGSVRAGAPRARRFFSTSRCRPPASSPAGPVMCRAAPSPPILRPIRACRCRSAAVTWTCRAFAMRLRWCTHTSRRRSSSMTTHPPAASSAMAALPRSRCRRSSRSSPSSRWPTADAAEVVTRLQASPATLELFVAAFGAAGACRPGRDARGHRQRDRCLRDRGSGILTLQQQVRRLAGRGGAAQRRGN